MQIIESIATNDGMLRVVERENMLALHNGESGYTCIYTDDSVYQPILIPIQTLFEDYFKSHHIKNVAILGGGCCSLPRFIIKRFGNTIFIDSIEYLPQIIDLTKKYFLNGLQTDKLNIIEADAFQYVKSTTTKYDFIFVDLFVGGNSIEQSHTKNFLEELSRLSTEQSLVVFNGYNRTLQQCKDTCEIGKHLFGKSFIMVDEDNTYYVAFVKGKYNEQGIKQYIL
jgi:spermidine synthase